jgi:hypothetical protein
MKTFAYSLFLIETIQTIMLAYDGIFQMGLEYGDPSELNSVGISWFSVPLISSIGKCSSSRESKVLTFFRSSEHQCARLLCLEDLRPL